MSVLGKRADTQILALRVREPKQTSEKPGTPHPQGLPHDIWPQGCLRKPSPVRSEITNYLRPDGAHGLESEILLRPECGGDSQKPKGLQVRVLQPPKEATGTSGHIPSAGLAPHRNGLGWVRTLPRWGKGGL